MFWLVGLLNPKPQTRYDRFMPPPYRFNVALRAFAESAAFETFSAVRVHHTADYDRLLKQSI
jgi:hypothetical protein